MMMMMNVYVMIGKKMLLIITISLFCSTTKKRPPLDTSTVVCPLREALVRIRPSGSSLVHPTIAIPNVN